MTLSEEHMTAVRKAVGQKLGEVDPEWVEDGRWRRMHQVMAEYVDQVVVATLEALDELAAPVAAVREAPRDQGLAPGQDWRDG